MPDRAENLRQATALVEAITKAPSKTFAIGLVLMYQKAILDKLLADIEAKRVRGEQPDSV